MTSNSESANKAYGTRRVISAKIPESLFDNIEKFREEQQYSCRNDAITILIVLGLKTLGKLSEEEVQQYTQAYGIEPIKGGSS